MGEAEGGEIVGRHRSTGIGRPAFWDRARYYGEHDRLAEALERAAGDADEAEAGFGADLLEAER
ncbi:MAG: hypothetical protein AAF322_18380, partial [Pseudomonadota bacterium]